jgi:hypothetical protein
MSSALSVARCTTNWLDKGGTTPKYEIECRIEQDDATAKVVGVYIKASLVNTVITVGLMSRSSNATFESGTILTTAPAGTLVSAVLADPLVQSMQINGLAGTGNRPLQVSPNGTIQVAPTITREAPIQSLPITNAAPGVVNVVDANMKSFGFDGGTQVEELFYHIDMQHDYVAGSDFIFHAHWMPATATGGNVRFKCNYQWVENGGVFPAATLVQPAAVAAGTTAWADKRTDFTFSGAGKTYSSRIMIRLFRDPGDAADTYAGDAVLSAVGGHYTANPIQP